VLDQIVQNHPNDVVAVRYHVWFPGDNDPFWQADSTEIRNRCNAYPAWTWKNPGWVYTVPWGHIDGRKSGIYAQWESLVTARAGVPSPLTLALSGWYSRSTRQGRINVHLENTTPNALGLLRLRYALTESGLQFGGHRYDQVLRKFFPDEAGDTLTLGGNVQADRGQDFSVGPSFNPDSCQLVMFVQKDSLLSDSTQEVLQSGKILVRDLPGTGLEGRTSAHRPSIGVWLGQAEPTPFKVSTRIAYGLPRAGDVRLAVYDAQGRLVKTLAEGACSAGTHDISVSGLESGIYFYRLEAGSTSHVKRMVVTK
jgi:hypothetical protein